MTFNPALAFIDCPYCDSAQHVERVRGAQWICNCCAREFEVSPAEAGPTRRTPASAGKTLGAPQLVLAVLLALLPALGNAQPQSQPLVQASNHQAVGSFTLPLPFKADNGPSALAVDGTSIYAGCGGGVAKFTMPATMGGVATLVTACTGLPNLDQIHPTDRNVLVGGILVWQGKLVVTVYVYYDGSYGATRSHYIGDSIATLKGPYTVATPAVGNNWPTSRPGMVAGYMAPIPAEWQALLGGPALTGQCCIPIIGRSSFGPSVSVFDPAHLDGRALINSTMLIGYPIEHQALGKWDASPPGTYYGGTDQLGSVALPPGTRSILFTGRHGDSWCYGPGTANRALVGTIDPAVSQYPYCYDPLDAYQGNHGPPYRPTVWAYDVNDVLAVKAGTKQPWDMRPYAKWAIPGMPVDNATNLLRAGTYDAATKRLFVASTDSNKVWVSAIDIAAVPPPPVPVDCVGTWSTWARVAGSETACVANQRTFTESRDFTVTTAASNGGKACPASPETRTASEDCADQPPPPPPTPAIRLECSHITTITRGADYVGGDQRWTVRGVCREVNALGVVVGPPKE